ncbi:SLBB domain-containing protein [Gammaproteobacteria bacterium]|nr:SLBB domain-containing protein [Gammaproteobacteria bacterium]
MKTLRNFPKQLLVVTLILSSTLSAQSIPGGVSPEMLNAIKSMPEDQRKAMARQYGIKLGDDLIDSEFQLENQLGSPGFQLEQYTQENIPQSPDGKLGNQEIKPDDDFQENSREVQLKRYGLDLFKKKISTFAPTDDAPVPPNYRLGVGDQIVIYLFGTDNRSLKLQVERNGAINFPQIGPIQISGLSFDDAANLIQKTVTNKFIGVEAFVSMGKLKAMNIFMAGEIKVPGAYSLSGLSTITQAIYQAGGITDIGSLRKIQVLRSGELIATFDAYDLLMRGDSSKDIRLKSGDVVFVPSYSGLVKVHGEVKRPMMYEINDETTVKDAISMAGGYTEAAFYTATLTSNASIIDVSQVKNINILTDSDMNVIMQNADELNIQISGEELFNSIQLIGALNRPGNYGWKEGMRVSEVLSNIRRDLHQNADLNFSLIVRNKNAIREISTHSFSISELVNNQGSAYDPVLYEFDQILIFSKEYNISDDVNGELSQFESVSRFNEEDYNRSALEYPMPNKNFAQKDNNFSAMSKADKELDQREESSEYVNSRQELLKPIIEKLKNQSGINEQRQLVSISGGVHFPGVYPLFEKATLNDLINAAGGTLDSAYLEAVEVRRLKASPDGVVPVFLENSLTDKSTNFALKSRDHITVRENSKWSEVNNVEITGAVRFPGNYIINDGDKLSEIIQRAGGLLDRSFPQGSYFTRESIAANEKLRAIEYARQIRQVYSSQLLTEETSSSSIAEVNAVATLLESVKTDGRLVIDLEEILSGDSNSDILLEGGDSLYIPSNISTVTVIGEVNKPTTMSFTSSFRTEDYINNAGGFTPRANAEDIYIIKGNGSVVVLNKSLFSFGRSMPEFAPGDTLVVPLKASYKDNLSLWTEVTQVIYQSLVSLAAVKGL